MRQLSSDRGLIPPRREVPVDRDKVTIHTDVVARSHFDLEHSMTRLPCRRPREQLSPTWSSILHWPNQMSHPIPALAWPACSCDHLASYVASPYVYGPDSLWIFAGFINKICSHLRSFLRTRRFLRHATEKAHCLFLDQLVETFPLASPAAFTPLRPLSILPNDPFIPLGVSVSIPSSSVPIISAALPFARGPTDYVAAASWINSKS